MKNNLAEKLAEKGLQQKQFAELLGVQPLSVWRWVHGKARTPDYAWRLLENYDPYKKTICYSVWF